MDNVLDQWEVKLIGGLTNAKLPHVESVCGELTLQRSMPS